jgi:hypothetical protein
MIGRRKERMQQEHRARSGRQGGTPIAGRSGPCSAARFAQYDLVPRSASVGRDASFPQARAALASLDRRPCPIRRPAAVTSTQHTSQVGQALTTESGGCEPVTGGQWKGLSLLFQSSLLHLTPCALFQYSRLRNRPPARQLKPAQPPSFWKLEGLKD